MSRSSKSPQAARDGGSSAAGSPRTLSIDIGGTGLKASVLDPKGEMVADRVRVPTPYPCPPQVMVDALVGMVQPLPDYDRISVGFPGVVRAGHVITAPHYGTDVWNGFDLAGALSGRLGRPARVLNDADMQGLAVAEGKGVELVITLGTGLGSALFEDGRLLPHLELAHHPAWKGKTYNQFVGEAVRKEIGKKKWNKRVRQVIDTLKALVNYDHLYVGGGNASKIAFDPDPDMTIVSNRAGILGGIKLWEQGS